MLDGHNAIALGLGGRAPVDRAQGHPDGVLVRGAADRLRLSYPIAADRRPGLEGGLLLWVLRMGAIWPPGESRLGRIVATSIGFASAKASRATVWAVAVADVSMSLDNVLAVAGAAHEHPGIMIVGLILSVALMGLAANLIAKYIERYRWIAYVGLLVILYVALEMIWEVTHDVVPFVMNLAA